MGRRPTIDRRPLLRALAGLLLVAVLVLCLTAWREPLLRPFMQRERLEDLLGQLGPFAPLAIILLQVAQILAAPVPGQVVGLASGFLFGPWLGALYSMAGLLLGSYLGVCLVRSWGRPLAERLFGREALARVDRYSERLGLPLLFLAFLLPFLPDDALLLVAGLTNIPMAGILLAAFLGRLPGVLVSSFIGARATAFVARDWLVAMSAVLVVAVPAYLRRGWLERLMWGVVERIIGRRSGGGDGSP